MNHINEERYLYHETRSGIMACLSDFFSVIAGIRRNIYLIFTEKRDPTPKSGTMNNLTEYDD